MDSIAPQSRHGGSTSAHCPNSPAGPSVPGNNTPAAGDSKQTTLTNTGVSGKRNVKAILLGSIALLFVGFCVKYSLYLAANRIYQVDECENVFVARILASGRFGDAYSTLSLFHLPLLWLARHATSSVGLFNSARLMSVVIFWINLLLLALATGARLFSRRGLIALVGACTLAPLWDYGFEVRHDNLLLTGLLFTWCALRRDRGRFRSYVISGALAVALQFTAFKAFVYTVPLAAVVLIFRPSGNTTARWKLVLAWAAGALGMLLLIRAAYGAAGLWGLYLSNIHRATTDATGNNRFAPWFTLQRLVVQTPLLLALLLAGLLSLLRDWSRRDRTVLPWDTALPEALLFLVAFGAILINPAPYPYNLVNLVPFAFLFVFRYATRLSAELWPQVALRPLTIAILIFGHFLPFAAATTRHLNWPNDRQKRLMQLAEGLTDPMKDPVYDGVGIVPMRSTIGFHWFLHSLNINSFRNGDYSVRLMLSKRPAAVIIPNYRTDWLPAADHDFIRQRYVPLADDFWVLGTVLPAGGGKFAIVHSGRYCVVPLNESRASSATGPESIAASVSPEPDEIVKGTLDGFPLAKHPVELNVGVHQLTTGRHCTLAVVWLGPHLEKLPRLTQGNHLALFAGWY